MIDIRLLARCLPRRTRTTDRQKWHVHQHRCDIQCVPLRFTADSSSLNHHPVIEIRGVGEWAELYRDTEGIFTGSASSEVVGRSSMTAVEIYAGAGGMSLGLRQAGFRMLAAYDSSPAAVAVYNRNVGYHATQHDLWTTALHRWNLLVRVRAHFPRPERNGQGDNQGRVYGTHEGGAGYQECPLPP